MAAAEVFYHSFVPAQVGHYAQLDLRVVGRHYVSVLVRRHEGLAYLLSLGRAYGYVLQVGLQRTQAAGGCQCLGEGGVDLTVHGVGELLERLDIGRDEFLQPSEFQYLVYQRMLMGQSLKRLLVSGIVVAYVLLGLVVEMQLFVEHDSDLSGTGKVKVGFSGKLAGFLLHLQHLCAEFAAVFYQGLGVDLHSFVLHTCQHLYHRHLYLRIEFRQSLRAEFFPELFLQQAAGYGLPGRTELVLRVFGSLLGGEQVALHRAVLLHGLVEREFQIALDQHIQLVRTFRVYEVVHYLYVVGISGEDGALSQQLAHHGLQVITGLRYGCIGQQRESLGIVRCAAAESVAGREYESVPQGDSHFRTGGGSLAELLEAHLAHLQRPDRSGHCLGQGLRRVRKQPAKRIHLVAGEQFGDCGVVARLVEEIILVAVQRNVFLYRYEELAQGYGVLRLSEFLLHFLGEAVQVGIDVLHAAPFAHKLLCALLSHSLHSGHVVRSVAPYGEYVYHLQGILDAVLGADGGLVDHLAVGSALAGLVLEYMVVDGLAEILVGGHHIDVSPFSRETGGEGAYHVVSLKTFLHYDGDAEGLRYLGQRLHRVDHELGSRGTVCLVFGIGLVAEGLGVSVEAYRHVGGMLLGKHFQKVLGEAEEDGGVLPLRIDHRPAEEGIEHPEDQGVTVYDKEFLHCLCLTAS